MFHKGLLQHQCDLQARRDQFFGDNRSNMALVLMANGVENTFNDRAIDKALADPEFELLQEDLQKDKQVFRKIISEYKTRLKTVL